MRAGHPAASLVFHLSDSPGHPVLFVEIPVDPKPRPAEVPFGFELPVDGKRDRRENTHNRQDGERDQAPANHLAMVHPPRVLRTLHEIDRKGLISGCLRRILGHRMLSSAMNW